MKRYYLGKLNKLQLICKFFLTSFIFIGIYLIVTLFIKFTTNSTYNYVLFPIIIITVDFLFVSSKNSGIRSFYFLDNNIVICKNKYERKIRFSSISALELLTDIDYLFGYKKVIVYINKRSYKLMLKKEKADKIIFWLEAKLEDYHEPLIDDLSQFLE